MNKYNAGVIIIGAEIADITAAIKLMNNRNDVILLDRDNDKELGRLVKLSRARTSQTWQYLSQISYGLGKCESKKDGKSHKWNRVYLHN